MPKLELIVLSLELCELALELLEARDQRLYNALTDCGAGGFSSAVGEMGEKIGAEVWLEKAPLKYDGLTYTDLDFRGPGTDGVVCPPGKLGSV